MSNKLDRFSFKTGPGLARASLLALALPLGACSGSADRTFSGAIDPIDYRERHPIALVEQPQMLDVFVVGGSGQLDPRTSDQIREFAATAQSQALAPVNVLLPRGTAHDALERAAVPSIRHALYAGGARGYVNVGTYPVADPQLASPIRLSFMTIKAKVASECGQWPRDLASGSSLDGWENRPYWNFGCASQNNLAAQVADPRDLVQARAEDHSDVKMRMRAIGRVQEGTDPGTTWVTKNTNLGTAGGS